MEIDWKVASVGVMLLLGVYSVALRKFFNIGEDWKVFLPIAGLVGLLALAYFAYSFKEIRYTGNTALLVAVIVVSIGLVTLLSMLVYADPKTQLNVAMPIMALAMVSTAVLSIFFLGETVTLRTWAGIAFALVAVLLLAK